MKLILLTVLAIVVVVLIGWGICRLAFGWSLKRYLKAIFDTCN